MHFWVWFGLNLVCFSSRFLLSLFNIFTTLYHYEFLCEKKVKKRGSDGLYFLFFKQFFLISMRVRTYTLYVLPKVKSVCILCLLIFFLFFPCFLLTTFKKNSGGKIIAHKNVTFKLYAEMSLFFYCSVVKK